MTQKQNIMLDLETLSTKSNALILSIGAVTFDSDGIGQEFYEVINLDDMISRKCFDVSEDTLGWWDDQILINPRAANVLQDAKSKSAKPANEVLEHFASWVIQNTSSQTVKLWGNGSDFDNVVLVNAFNNVMSTRHPWEWYNHRCYRTIKSTFNMVKPERKGVHHHALDDAKFQAHHLIHICNGYGIPL